MSDYMVVCRPVWGADRILRQGNQERMEKFLDECLDGFYTDVPKQASFYLCRIIVEVNRDGRLPSER